MNHKTQPVLILGRGQLGSQFVSDYNGPDLMCLDYPDLDITNPEHDEKIVQLQPAVIINCAAFTDVDRAEAEPQLARSVNATAPGRLSQLAKSLGAKFVHISTDYVFDGAAASKPYQEQDVPNPINVYGQTKLEGERLVSESGADHLIIRTAWLSGGSGPNFILKMLSLAKTKSELSIVTDQTGSPTFTKDLAAAIMSLLEQEQSGLFHVVNTGMATKFELARELFRLAGLETKLIAAKSSDFPSAARRPAFTPLSTKKLSRYFEMPSWQQGLKRYYDELLKSQ